VDAMLPEAIYIPAVKDLKDETKTTETSSFGKILKIIMDRIEPLLAQEKALFEKLTERITRVPNHEGVLEDRRLHEIRDIEKTMQTFLQESFSTVSLQLEIPPPSISSVLSTAKILANDGIQGPLDLKGDGLRRAVVFSILRTYVELAAQQEMINAKKKANQPESEQSDSPSAAAELASPVKTKTRSYILLFEEPELFLHPDAQRILFDALRVFSNDHHVVVTTHSPSFLGPQATATFVRLSKHTAEGVSKPFTQAKPVDLKGLIPKDEFQIICFENNAAAFFSRRVVLVEGDSDLIVFPHLAQLLNPNWTCLKNSVSFTRVNGKGNIPRYRRFFERFDVPTFVIADLDVIAEGLLELDLGEPVRLAREYLLNAITTHLVTQEPPLPSVDDAKEAQANRGVRALWKNVRDAHKAFEADPQCFGRLDKAVEEFFAWEKKHAIRDALRKPPTDRIGQLMAHLLELLRGYLVRKIVTHAARLQLCNVRIPVV
jgi:putative ATP-dependent endonuclease of the OLD family